MNDGDGYFCTCIGAMAVSQADHEKLIQQLREELGRARNPWVAADKAPAGHDGIVRQELAEGTWCYRLAEWRVCRGIEGWFDNEGGQLVNVTYWMPIPDDPAHRALISARNAALKDAQEKKL
jgi:hypothetical protein